MNQDQLRDQVINALVEAHVAGVDGSIVNSQAHEVAAVVAPLLADLEAARDNAITVGDRLGWRLVEAEQEIARLNRQLEFEMYGGDNFSGADRAYETREEDEECSGRDVTGQASREEAAEQTFWPHGCPCLACVPADADPLSFVAQMHVCPHCGNKRCPGAANHDNTCSGSNEPGQPGSLYGPPLGGEVSDG